MGRAEAAAVDVFLQWGGDSSMKLEEEFVGRRVQFAELLHQVADQLMADELSIRGRRVEMPDVDMEYKVSHKHEDGEHKLQLAIEWLDPDPEE
jgi:amphi-Trp domain-containing protein